MRLLMCRYEGTSQGFSATGVICMSLICILALYTNDVHGQDDICANQWLRLDDTLYRIEETARDYANARTQCQSYGGDLAVVDTEPIENYIISLLSEPCSSFKYYWIGLHDLFNTDEYVWIDGTPLNSSIIKWYGSEPTGDLCIALVTRTGIIDGKRWIDYPCSSNSFAICSMSFDLPKMTAPPEADEIGTNHVAISWDPWQDIEGNGLGPVRAYIIYRRTAEDAGDWANVGYVDNADAGGDRYSFNLTNQNPGTEMEISIAAIHFCTGEEGERGSILLLTTYGVPESQDPMVSDPGDDSSGGSSAIPWALFSTVGIVGNIIGLSLLVYTCMKLRNKANAPPVPTSPRPNQLRSSKMIEGEYEDLKDIPEAVYFAAQSNNQDIKPAEDQIDHSLPTDCQAEYSFTLPEKPQHDDYVPPSGGYQTNTTTPAGQTNGDNVLPMDEAQSDYVEVIADDGQDETKVAKVGQSAASTSMKQTPAKKAGPAASGEVDSYLPMRPISKEIK